MNVIDRKNIAVGQFVIDCYSTAQVFEGYGIDYYCRGNQTLAAACKKSKLNMQEILIELESVGSGAEGEFKNMSVDELTDYILTAHHDGIRETGPQLLQLIVEALRVDADRYINLYEVKTLFSQSLVAFDDHFYKEENILFPYINEIYKASLNNEQLPPMHCGTVANPIAAMEADHDDENERYGRIAVLLNHFEPHDDDSEVYKSILANMKLFVANLHEHMHIENNILFPRSVLLEKSCVSPCCGY